MTGKAPQLGGEWANIAPMLTGYEVIRCVNCGAVTEMVDPNNAPPMFKIVCDGCRKPYSLKRIYDILSEGRILTLPHHPRCKVEIIRLEDHD